MIFAINIDFQKIGIVEQFESLIWHDVWNGVGDFELHIPKDLNCSYIYDSELGLMGIVENTQITQYKTVLKGRLLKAVLDRWVWRGNGVYPSRPIETNVKSIVEDATSFRVGNMIDVVATQNRGHTTDAIYPLGANVLAYTEKLLLNSNLSSRLTYDFATQRMTYDLVETIDKSNDVPIGIEFGNLIDWTYTKDTSDYRVTAKGVGAENSSGIAERFLVGQGGDEANYFTNRDIWFDLSSLLRQDADGNPISDSDYTSMLRQTATDKLGEYRITEAIEIEPVGFFELGEIRTFKGGGIVAKQMVTDVVYAYEEGRIKKSCTFGYQRLNRVSKLERRFTK